VKIKQKKKKKKKKKREAREGRKRGRNFVEGQFTFFLSEWVEGKKLQVESPLLGGIRQT